MATISAPLVTGITAGGSSTISGTFTAGAPTGLSQVLDGTTTTVSSPTITTTSGSGASAAGTYSYVITTPAAGAHSITVNGTGTYAATGTATAFTTVNWYLMRDAAWVGPVSAVAAGQVLQDGWIDVSGNSFTIDSSNYTNGQGNKYLEAPSTEDKADLQITARVLLSSTRNVYLSLRFNRNSTSPTGYFGFMSTTGIVIAKIIAGAYTTLGSMSVAGLTAGTLYDVTFSAIQTNGTTTALTISAATTSGTVLGAYSINDTTTSLQNVVGSAATYTSIISGSAGSDTARLRTYTDATATTYTLIGPSSGVNGVASAPFSVTPNGGVTAAVTIAPSDGGAGGTFTPSVVTIPAGSATAQTFTYTPAAVGSVTISTSSGGALTDPSSATYSSTLPPITLGVTSAAAKFSPGNWKGDTGRGGSVYRQTWNVGAWFSYTWTASSSPTASLLISGSAGSGNTLAYFLNGVLTDSVAANSGNVALSGIVSSASNTVIVYNRAEVGSSRWNNAGDYLRVQGLQIDGNSSPGVAPPARPWLHFVGDSISEGYNAAAGPAESHILAYSFFVGRALDQLGYDTGMSVCQGTGWLTAGDTAADVPGYYIVSGSSGGAGGTYSESTSRWDKIDQGVPLLDVNGQISSYGSPNTGPAAIIINYITNEALGGKNTSDCQASVTQALTALRASAPTTFIVLIVPFGLYSTTRFPSGANYIAALKNGLSAYQAANPGDLKTALIDLGATFAATIQNGVYTNVDTLHLTAAGHAIAAPQVMGKLMNVLLTPTPRYRYR